ncbi:MAG: hypothetical protein IPK50_07525 [Fibrobacterota bacterium]|nr:hypothetical protein [Fibrobacterota bacterium]QQS06742.1 MAG: hypothetical protein IPK50_07525 [Fibrobacterota bacterium]
MKKLSLLTAAVALTAVGAHADWLLSDYATVAADSAAVNKYYGAQTFGNKASTTSLSAGAGSIVFKATLASDATEGYTANVGLLHPLGTDWAETDLTGITGVTFEYKNSAAITDALAFSFGSGAYTEAIAKAGTVYENTISGKAALAAHSSWTPATMDILDFAPPKWWTPTTDFPAIAAVLKKVKNVQFAPKTLYTGDGTQNAKACTKCVGPDMTAITLELRNITLKGINAVNWPNPQGIGCEATQAVTKIDDFTDGNEENELGGYWYPFSDSGDATVAKDMADKAKGSSKATIVVDTAGPALTMTAKLNKTLGTTWHDYAGWASVGMGFAGDGGITGGAAITAIGFQILGVGIDKTVPAVNFKATMAGVSDTALHQVALPVSEMSVEGSGGKKACIRPEDLLQASYVAASHKVAFDASKLMKMSWELKIKDQSSSAINAAAGAILLQDVKFYGSASIVSGTRNHKSKISGFSVRSSEGVLSLSGYQGIQSFDVVSLDGKKITSFAPAATVALSLPRGSYFLVGKRDGASLTKSFAVVR